MIVRSPSQKRAARNLWIAAVGTLAVSIGCIMAIGLTDEGSIWRLALIASAFLSIPVGMYPIMLFGSRMDGRLLSRSLPGWVSKLLTKLHLPTE